MKIAKYALAACVVSLGFTSMAQDNTQKANCKEKCKEKCASSEASNEKKKAHVMDALELSDDQREEIESLREELNDKRATLKADESLDEAARMEQMKALKAEKKSAMEEILTEDQQEKLTAMKAEMKAERKANKKDVTPGEVAEKQTAKMIEVIEDLTPEQEERLRILNLKVANKIDAIKKDDTMTDEKKKEFIKGNKEDKRRMLESILTEAQLAQWDAHVANKKKMKFEKKKTTESPKSE
ncbi:hypothetical protein N9Y60_01485 [Crocinitomicaceae bacterium]|nr:hypothetical protein [Crocinitomicaceae bacterium]MDB3906873.1 hypothetical protein [Crocinitomicaceae bacterium]